MSYRKKLIEVALPLEAINKEAAREKSIRHGHPSTLHLWWARRPLAACRAVLFSSLVDDPDEPDAPQEYLELLDKLPGDGDRRQKLFRFIEELVKWDNSNDEAIIGKARELILASTEGNPPPVLDPFCGGGSIPLEAQRLGLEAHASDLNPVAVLITKALIEIPPKFANRAPVHPADEDANQKQIAQGEQPWRGAQGLAAYVRYYGQWMRDEAEKRIGHLYPKGPNGETVIAWLWARTVKCPNPACGAMMPLARSFVLSKKKNSEAHVVPIPDPDSKTVRFDVREGSGEAQGTVKNRAVTCVVCGQQCGLDHVRSEAQAGRMSAKLMATVTEGERSRTYIAPTDEHAAAAASAQPPWKPDEKVPTPNHDVDRLPMYGMYTWGDAFTPRQLVALTTFSDLVGEARERVKQDAVAAGMADDGVGIEEGGLGAQAYADAVATYLAFAVDRSVDRGSTICTWDSSPKMEALRNTFARQALPMTWDFAEGNPFSASSGNWMNNVDWVAKSVVCWHSGPPGKARQLDAMAGTSVGAAAVVSTDPPYYDNIGYADLSDFFYVWLRRTLQPVYPQVFSTLLVPKAEELVATPSRFGGNKKAASAFFEDGFHAAFVRLREACRPGTPATVYYAFKQAEAARTGVGETSHASTGWETMLEGLLRAGFGVTGTWPMRSELSNRMVASGTNALASSIALACRPRPENAPMATRREFITALRGELPDALRNLQKGNIAPVDMAQAAIGPGMAVFSRYSKVLESDGSAMTVRTALGLINQALDEVLAEQEGVFDPDTRWAVAWFEQSAFNEGAFGDAETLSKAKNTSVSGMVEAGIAKSGAGKVRLLRRDELPVDWDPSSDRRFTVWEAAQHLIRALEQRGEGGAADLLKRLGGVGETARDLAYRLYNICERKQWAQEALPYNSLVIAWPEIVRLASSEEPGESPQTTMEMDE